MPRTLTITFERPDGSRYDAELDREQLVILTSGEAITADCLTCGDAVDCHDFPDAGHTVIR